jgi:hypothetical protein
MCVTQASLIRSYCRTLAEFFYDMRSDGISGALFWSPRRPTSQERQAKPRAPVGPTRRENPRANGAPGDIANPVGGRQCGSTTGSHWNVRLGHRKASAGSGPIERMVMIKPANAAGRDPRHAMAAPDLRGTMLERRSGGDRLQEEKKPVNQYLATLSPDGGKAVTAAVLGNRAARL